MARALLQGIQRLGGPRDMEAEDKSAFSKVNGEKGNWSFTTVVEDNHRGNKCAGLSSVTLKILFNCNNTDLQPGVDLCDFTVDCF